MHEKDEAEQIRLWLEGVLRTTGLKPTPLAKQAGLAPSTLLRALDPDNPTTLERNSIAKIAKFGAQFGVAPLGTGGHTPAGTGLPARHVFYGGGLAEDDLLPFQGEQTENPQEPALTSNQYLRTINTRALELAGYLPGDSVVFDMSVAPREGDAVAANVYKMEGGAKTVLRIYDPPYLVARTMDQRIMTKPRPVDDHLVKIMAVAIRLVRARP